MAQRKPKMIQIRPNSGPERAGDFTRDTLPPGFSGQGDRVIKKQAQINVNQVAPKTSAGPKVTQFKSKSK